MFGQFNVILHNLNSGETVEYPSTLVSLENARQSLRRYLDGCKKIDATIVGEGDDYAVSFPDTNGYVGAFVRVSEE